MNNIIDEILKSNNIVLLCHNNPDGDAIGSTLAMYHTLKKLGKEVDIVIKDVPTKFSFIEGYNEIKESSEKQYNLGIILDTANIERLNNPNDIFNNIDKKIVIDHHKTNTNYGDLNYVEVSPANCQILYKIIKNMNVEIDEKIATPLATGLLTDTGSFSHPDVIPETFEVAADLSKIVDIPSINKKVLGTITKAQFDLKKLGIDNLEFHNNNQIAYSYITYKDLEKLGLAKNECDILAGIGREIENVELSIFVRVFEEEIRVSLRSNNIDVNEIAKVFGGGGHKNAAGITLKMEYNDLKEKILEVAGKEIEKWNNSSK